ncbi:MAG: MTH1187 family thiamine-binding protein [Magnetococcus sp. MYC-9]
MSLLLEFSMTPLDKGESVSGYVARSLDIIDKSGLPYKLGPMGTCLEGEWDACMAVVKECLTAMQADCRRVTFSIKADYRADQTDRLTGKMASVTQKVGRPLQV